MRKPTFALAILLLLAVACGPAATPPVISGETVLPSPTPPPPTLAPTVAPTPLYPPEGYGPSGFPADVDPLTGLKVANPALLERRPLAVKVTNLPRNTRPQWGLSLADIVFEYYTEEGSTRFIALFYGKDADMVGPIRSARFFDAHVVRGYKAVFAFGSAYVKVLNRLFSSDFADRLVIEGPNTPLTRYDPEGFNHLVVNTAALSAYMTQRGVANGRQNLDGMFFQMQPPAGGGPGPHAYARYSAAIYNRWDYDPSTGKYLRYSETDNDLTGGQNEQYALLTDRLNLQPIAYDNVVVLFVNTEHYNLNPEVVDILFLGSGSGYAFRDGQAYPITWQRNAPDAVVSLTNPDGTPFAFKPGTTWFEVMGMSSKSEQVDGGMRFTHFMP